MQSFLRNEKATGIPVAFYQDLIVSDNFCPAQFDFSYYFWIKIFFLFLISEIITNRLRPERVFRTYRRILYPYKNPKRQTCFAY